MLLSVIIVNYNVKFYLEQCLLSVLASSIATKLEIIVVDNCSSDGSLEYLMPHFPNVKFIRNKENRGFAKANNIAIKQATGDYILLLNPDTIVGEQVLENTCSLMEKDSKIGAIGVKMIDSNGFFLPESKRGFPSLWVSFCKMSGLNSFFPQSKLFGKYHLRYLNENQPHIVDVLAGAFMLLRKQTLDCVGLLDERFFMYGEDIDLSYRIKKAGFDVLYVPERILHYKGESAHKNDLRYVQIFFEAMYLFFKKHYTHYTFLHLFLVRIGMLIGGTHLLLKNRWNALTKAHQTSKATNVYEYPKLSFTQIIEKIEHSKKNKNSLNYICNTNTNICIGENGDIKKKEDLF